MLIRLLLITVALCIIAPTNALGANYNVIDLGVLPGATGFAAYGINDAGQVVGTFGSSPHAFFWDPVGGMRDLGPIDGEPVAINNRAQVTGTSSGHALFWSAETGRLDLGTLSGDHQSWGFDITDDGHVFGTSVGTAGQHVFEWSAGGGMQDLALPGQQMTNVSVNEARQVAYTVWGRPPHAFLWDETDGARDLGEGETYGISGNGRIVGSSSGEASVWDSTGGMRLLGMLPGGSRSAGYGINDVGRAVGISYENSGGCKAFVWSESTGMTELPGLNGLYYRAGAMAISSAGVITGCSTAADGTAHAVIWTPIPEPSSLVALSAGLVSAGAVVGRRRRR